MYIFYLLVDPKFKDFLDKRGIHAVQYGHERKVNADK